MSARRSRGAHPAARVLAPLLAAFVLTTSMGLAQVRPVSAGAPEHRDQLRFMWAMAGQESGWDYYARNASSGAYGKYQIMPFNWPVWAEDYLGDRTADQTPFNQERVAFGKLRDLYRWLGSWKRVAYWWLTGSSEPDPKRWTGYARGYVDNIMQLRKRAPDGWAMPPRTSSRAGRGDWRVAQDAQRLRLTLAGRPWPSRGRIRDGQVLRVASARQTARGTRWMRVVTADGRSGWLPQVRTVPARRPDRPGRWADVEDRGGRPPQRDRGEVRPRPR